MFSLSHILVCLVLAAPVAVSSSQKFKIFTDFKKAAFLKKIAWKDIQKQSENAIVQVVCHGADSDPLRPYVKQSSEGRGSGSLIFDADQQGLILTSYHVIEEAIEVGVLMPLYSGKKMLKVSVVGVCPDYDIALLQLDPAVCKEIIREYGALPALALGDSDNVDRSDQLLGLGFPLGDESLKSVTGVVSGYGHINAHNKLRVHSSYVIQVTTPLNPGGSGGPVLNKKGEVIGIVMAGAGDAQNVGYVAPINYYKILRNQLKKGGLVRKPCLGVQVCRAKDNELAQYLGNPVPAGCYITHVIEGSLAASLGMQEGDMVYKINGFMVDPYGCVQQALCKDRLYVGDYLSSLPLGHSLDIELYRRGVKKVLAGHLTLAPQPPAIRWNYAPYDVIDYEIIGGLLIQELSFNIIAVFEHTQWGNQMPHVRARLSPYKQESMRETPVLIVTHVFPSSLAYSSSSFGIGTFITELQGQPVKTLTEMREILKNSEEKFIAFTGDEKELLVLSVGALLQDESRLSQSFGYSSTPALCELMRKQTYNVS